MEIKLSRLEDSLLDSALEIYLEAFPPDERRPWKSILSPDDIAGPRLQGIFADGRLVGMVTTWAFDNFTYVEHLALSTSTRGQGIGSKVVAALKASSAVPLLLEVEPRHLSDQAARRIGFYARAGFDVIDTGYVQPPYSPHLSPVALWLMASGRVDPDKAAATLHSRVYRAV